MPTRTDASRPIPVDYGRARRCNNRYAQVLLTYVWRPAFAIIVAALAASIGAIELIGYFNQRAFRSSSPFMFNLSNNILWVLLEMLALLAPFALVIMLVTALVTHAHDQLTNWRSRLFPGYVRPHRVAAAIIFELLVIAIACFGYFGSPRINNGPSFIGILAIVVTIATVLAWIGVRWSGWLAGALFCVCVVVLASNRRLGHEAEMAAYFLTGQNRARSVFSGMPDIWAWPAGVVISVLLLVPAVYVQIRLILEKPRAAASAGGWRATVGEWRRSTAPRRFSPIRAFTPPVHRPARGLWRRAWHRRLAVLRPGAGAWTAALLAAILLLISLIAGPDRQHTDALRALLLATLTPGIITAAIWRDRWLVLGNESLFPGRRRDFIREGALVMALNLAEFWLASALAAAVALAIWDPSVLHPPALIESLAASALMQALVFGVIFLMTPLRWVIAYLVILTLLMIGLAIPFELAWAPQPDLTAARLLLIAAVEMPFGLCMALAGIGLWRKTQWG